jgi:hypothetical protein
MGRAIAQIATCCAVLVSGCDATRAQENRFAVRDSAGIRIVESIGTTRWPASWSLGAEPVWAVGEVEGDPAYLLSRVVGAMTLPTGEVVVGNRGTNELRFYAPDGTHVQTRGGDGQGPGEFEYLRGLAPCHAGGFIAFDLNWQMNAYLFDGTFVEKTTLQTPVGVTPYEIACDERGHVLMLGWGRDVTDGPQEGFYSAFDDLLLTDRRGNIQTDFGERLASERIGGRFGSRPHPAGRATLFALHDDRVYEGSGERFEVEVRDLDGGLLELMRGPRLGLEVTDSVRALILEVNLRSASPQRHEEIRSAFAGWTWPPTLPAYAALQVDSEGVVWLRAFAADEAEAEVWSLIEPERGYVGDLTLGPRQTLLEVGTDHVLVVARDELDVERVERYELRRDAGAR